MGDVEDFSNFINAVIDKPAFDTISEYIEKARHSKDAKISMLVEKPIAPRDIS